MNPGGRSVASACSTSFCFDAARIKYFTRAAISGKTCGLISLLRINLAIDSSFGRLANWALALYTVFSYRYK
jgi:hypothetical protein